MNQTRWTGPAIGENNVFSDKWAAVQARSQITNIMHSLNGAERSLFLTAISSFSEHGPNTLKCNPSWFSSNNNTGYATSASVSFRQFIGVFQDVHPNHREQYYEQWINEASKLDISDMIHEVCDNIAHSIIFFSIFKKRMLWLTTLVFPILDLL